MDERRPSGGWRDERLRSWIYVGHSTEPSCLRWLYDGSGLEVMTTIWGIPKFGQGFVCKACRTDGQVTCRPPISLFHFIRHIIHSIQTLIFVSWLERCPAEMKCFLVCSPMLPYLPPSSFIYMSPNLVSGLCSLSLTWFPG